jgi:hypothetical protein
MNAAARGAAWAGALFGLWLLLVGTNTGLEEIGGACAAIVAGLVAVRVARLSERRIAVAPHDALRFSPLALRIAPDFLRALRALVRARAGAFATVPLPVGGDDPRSRGRRALVGVLGSLASMRYVVDLDPDRKLALVHDLDPRRARRDRL